MLNSRFYAAIFLALITGCKQNSEPSLPTNPKLGNCYHLHHKNLGYLDAQLVHTSNEDRAQWFCLTFPSKEERSYGLLQNPESMAYLGAHEGQLSWIPNETGPYLASPIRLDNSELPSPLRIHDAFSSYLALDKNLDLTLSPALTENALFLKAIPKRSHLTTPESFNAPAFKSALKESMEQSTPKKVWLFWNSGERNLPSFEKRNLALIRKVLGPSWDVTVVSADPSDKNYLPNITGHAFVPKAFNLMPPALQSDVVLVATLQAHGGVYIDMGVLLTKTLDELWPKLFRASSYVMGGYTMPHWGKKAFDYKDYLELYFLASKPNNPMMTFFGDIMMDYFETRFFPIGMEKSALFERHNWSELFKWYTPNYEYFSMYLIFRKALQDYPDFSNAYLNHADIHDAAHTSLALVQGYFGYDFERFQSEFTENFNLGAFEATLNAGYSKFTGYPSKLCRLKSFESHMVESNTLSMIYQHFLK